ncbi:MAG: hypothetical protein OXK80_03675 [Bdellovibrionales bacterium]|nr:hypothetical protein [Bdellovibrionales bacterium]
MRFFIFILLLSFEFYTLGGDSCVGEFEGSSVSEAIKYQDFRNLNDAQYHKINLSLLSTYELRNVDLSRVSDEQFQWLAGNSFGFESHQEFQEFLEFNFSAKGLRNFNKLSSARKELLRKECFKRDVSVHIVLSNPSESFSFPFPLF